MYSDKDIKIAGDKPSKDIKKNIDIITSDKPDKAETLRAENWGKSVALKFIEDAKENNYSEDTYAEMLMQRRMLLSFTATIGFETLSLNETLSGIAQKSFLETVKLADAELYRTSADTGAFSFYYLAFRRGNEIDRRMGQTFAMLCSHDGDPIYQELGEALYCWFFSEIKKSAEEYGII